MEKKKKPLIGRIVVGILVFFGILFLLILLWPEDKEEVSEKGRVASVVEGSGDESEGSGDGDDENPGDSDSENPGNNDNGSNMGKEEGREDIDPVSVGNDAKNATILIYMNGSDLETKAGEATTDISEMLSSGIGKNVNVLIQTMGTKKWQDHGISSKTSQIYRIRDKKLELVKDDLGQLDCTEASTLSDFIKYGKKKCPADRYILLFWDHGGGPVYGFGVDEWQDEGSSLTLDEIDEALSENDDVHFDMIGMDCCIMASVETCYALSGHCKYALLSEDFESGLGWSYESWMKKFEHDPGMSTPLLGKKIIDAAIDANDGDSDYGGSSTLVLINERAVPDLLNKWIEYAYKNEDVLLSLNYSRLHMAKGKSSFSDFFDLWGEDGSNVTMEDYYVSDMLSIVETAGINGDESDDLRNALKTSVAYFGHTKDKNELTGLSVSLPYGNYGLYTEMADIYNNIGIDPKYVDWLENFVNAEGSEDYCDYSGFEDSWGGWGSYGDGYSACSTSDAWCYDDGGSDQYSEDWVYDYEDEIWYLYQDGVTYLYDDETETMYYYDEENDEIYVYDDENDDWYLTEW